MKLRIYSVFDMGRFYTVQRRWFGFWFNLFEPFSSYTQWFTSEELAKHSAEQRCAGQSIEWKEAKIE